MICFYLIIKFLGFFLCFLLCFLFPVCCYIFHLAKLLVALDTLIAVPVNLNFFLIQAQTITFHCFGAYQLISLLNLPNSATAILYHSSLALSFSSLQSLSTWCDNCSIRSLSNFSLIMIIFFENVCGGVAAFDRQIACLVLGKISLCAASVDLNSVICQSFIYLCRIYFS